MNQHLCPKQTYSTTWKLHVPLQDQTWTKKTRYFPRVYNTLIGKVYISKHNKNQYPNYQQKSPKVSLHCFYKWWQTLHHFYNHFTTCDLQNVSMFNFLKFLPISYLTRWMGSLPVAGFLVDQVHWLDPSQVRFSHPGMMTRVGRLLH